MAKLTRKEKVALQQKNKPAPKKTNTSINSESISRIISKNWKFFILLAVLIVGLYYNSIDNQLTLVDDIQAFVENEKIKDLPATLRSLYIQKIVYAVSYQFFEYNPLPIRIVSIILHVLITFLVFIFINLLYDRKTAIIASLVFATHAVNTEAVTWISGSAYLYIALFNFLVFIPFLLYRKHNQNKYLYLAIFIYILKIIILQSPWVLVTPMALIVLDMFFIQKKINTSKLGWLLFFILPISLYLVTNFSGLYAKRLTYREGSGNRVTLHTQAFTPVFEGYPYTTYLMTKLYLFPKDLSVYYDGMEVTTFLYLKMYATFFVYIGLTIYLWKKNRRFAGILLLLPILIAPTYSPVKMTWFLAERYMYSGIAFFGILVAQLVFYINSKTGKKFYGYGFLVLLISLYSVRTILRNDDWQNTVTLAEANIKVAPLSVRPYNDAGGHYFYAGEIDKAVEFYEKGLEVVPSSGTAINNLGYIYMGFGPLVLRDDFQLPEQDHQKALEYYNFARSLNAKGEDPKTISFFMNRAVSLHIDNLEYWEALAELFFEFRVLHFADDLYAKIQEMDPGNELALRRRPMIEVMQKNAEVQKQP